MSEYERVHLEIDGCLQSYSRMTEACDDVRKNADSYEHIHQLVPHSQYQMISFSVKPPEIMEKIGERAANYFQCDIHLNPKYGTIIVDKYVNNYEHALTRLANFREILGDDAKYVEDLRSVHMFGEKKHDTTIVA